MKYYKYLDLDYKLVCDKIKKYLGNELPNVFWTRIDKDDMISKIPELQEMFNPLKIHIHKIAILTAWFHRPGIIHVDACDAKVRINLPILNCEDTVTNFYQTTSTSIESVLPNNVPFHRYNPEHCKLVDQFRLTKPAAIRIGAPHQVYVLKGEVPRISCTIEFEENIEYLLD
jgi:hypothetical protein